jgi:choline kinase
MKAVILAAGQGRRLAPSGWDKPKCLLPCPEGTLLGNILQSILECGIHKVVIVVGYRRELVERAVLGEAVSCRFVVNEDYAATNTVHSLWLARDYLDEGILYFNGDVWFERPLLSLLLRQSDSALAVDAKPCGAEEVKVKVDRAGRITRIGKDIPPQDALGEFIGVAKFAPSACAGLVESLRGYNGEGMRRDFFFESALNDILDRHVFLAAPIGNLRAVEIDTPEDYARAKSLWTR